MLIIPAICLIILAIAWLHVMATIYRAIKNEGLTQGGNSASKSEEESSILSGPAIIDNINYYTNNAPYGWFGCTFCYSPNYYSAFTSKGKAIYKLLVSSHQRLYKLKDIPYPDDTYTQVIKARICSLLDRNQKYAIPNKFIGYDLQLYVCKKCYNRYRYTVFYINCCFEQMYEIPVEEGKTQITV